MPDSLEQHPQTSKRLVFLRALILIVTALVSFVTLVLPLALRPDALPLTVGDVSPQDLQAAAQRWYLILQV